MSQKETQPHLTIINACAAIVPARVNIFSLNTPWLPRFRQRDGKRFSSTFSQTTQSVCEAATLKTSIINKDATAQETCDGLGGEVAAEISMYQYFEFLRRADYGYSYLAFIKDDKGDLSLVDANWLSEGWYFGAFELSDAYHFPTSHIAVSRKLDAV